MLYFTSWWLFCDNQLILLNPFNFLPIPPAPSTPLPSGSHQNVFCIYEAVSVLLVCLFCFLDSIVNIHVFIAIYVIFLYLFLLKGDPLFFLRFYLFIFRERREGERGAEHGCVRERLIGCLSHAPKWGPGPQPRHVPWPGIEPDTFRFAGWCSILWATPTKAEDPLTFHVILVWWW